MLMRHFQHCQNKTRHRGAEFNLKHDRCDFHIQLSRISYNCTKSIKLIHFDKKYYHVTYITHLVCKFVMQVS